MSFQISSSAPQPTGAEVVQDAEFLTSSLLLCRIPAAMTTHTMLRGVMVAVSYNQQASSRDALFMAYNPTCYSCNATTQTCTTDVGFTEPIYGILLLNSLYDSFKIRCILGYFF